MYNLIHQSDNIVAQKFATENTEYSVWQNFHTGTYLDNYKQAMRKMCILGVLSTFLIVTIEDKRGSKW